MDSVGNTPPTSPKGAQASSTPSTRLSDELNEIKKRFLDSASGFPDNVSVTIYKKNDGQIKIDADLFNKVKNASSEEEVKKIFGLSAEADASVIKTFLQTTSTLLKIASIDVKKRWILSDFLQFFIKNRKPYIGSKTVSWDDEKNEFTINADKKIDMRKIFKNNQSEEEGVIQSIAREHFNEMQKAAGKAPTNADDISSLPLSEKSATIRFLP